MKNLIKFFPLSFILMALHLVRSLYKSINGSYDELKFNDVKKMWKLEILSRTFIEENFLTR